MIINQIGGGKKPTGTKSITSNGIHDVSDYASADVQVPTTAPAYYRSFLLENGELSSDPTAGVMNFSGIRTVQPFLFASMYETTKGDAQHQSIVSGDIDMSDITNIGVFSFAKMFGSEWNAVDGAPITSCDLSGLSSIPAWGCYQMFRKCKQLKSCDLSSVSTMSSGGAYRMFDSCTSLETVDLSGLTNIGAGSGQWYTNNNISPVYYMFEGCTSLKNINLDNLQVIGAYGAIGMFAGCTSLETVDLSALTSIQGFGDGISNMFYGCTSLKTVDLSGLTQYSGVNQFSNTFSGCTSLENVYLNDALTKRNPPVLLKNVPVSSCAYENLEYIAGSNTDGLCSGQKLVSVDMRAFEMCNISNINMFSNNTTLTNIKFPVLTRWNGTNYAGGMLNGCTNANFTDVYFPMLCVFRNAVPFSTTSFPSQLTVHFRKDQQALIQSTAGASSNFGAAALVFDQIGTITVNGTDYIRQGKCNETGYYAWQKATSNITVGGVVYTFDITQMTRNSTNANAAGDILYGWINGSTIIYTNSLKPQVGDYIWTTWNVDQSTTPITAVDNEFVFTVDSAEPAVSDTVYSDTTGTVLGTISSIA